MTTLKNDYHHTSIRIRYNRSNGETDHDILLNIAAWAQNDPKAKRLYYRIRKTLCGCDDCSCGIVR